MRGGVRVKIFLAVISAEVSRSGGGCWMSKLQGMLYEKKTKYGGFSLHRVGLIVGGVKGQI